LVTKVVKGYRRTEWQKIRDRNEALDGRCYARAAAAAAGMDRYTDVTWKTIEDNIADRAKRVGQPAAPATNLPKPLMRPVTLPSAAGSSTTIHRHVGGSASHRIAISERYPL
jgi:phage terminase large subunit GpA-like protein